MKNLTESDVIALIVPLAKSIALKYESIGIVGIEQGPEAHQITVTLADGETYTLTFSLAAAGVSFTPATGMSSTNVQDAINELLGELLLAIDDIVLKADKVENAIDGDFAGLDVSGNLTDSGIAIKDFPKTFTRLEKKADYLYDIYYDSIDYATAEEYFKTKGPTSALGSCSMVRNGNFIGRNFDWLYSEDVEFVVQIPANAGRYATTGVVGTVRDGAKALTKSFVESGAYSSLYSVLPFMIVDGWNSKGVYCGTNVVPKQKNNGNLISPSGTVEKKICMIMLPRFVIDNFATATEAVTYLQEHVALFPSKTLSETYQYEQHFIIADKTKTYLVEFVDSEIVVTEKNYMTNFYLDGVTFNNDGKVYTPADVPSGHSPTEDNGITSLGSGLERYNLIVDNYSTANTAQGMRNLMDQLLYSRAYSTSPDVADPDWYTEFVGINNLTVDSTPTEFAQTYTNAGTMFTNRSRNPQSQNFGIWQTVHSCVYDYENMKLSLISQENTSKTFEYILGEDINGNVVINAASDTVIDTYTVPQPTDDQIVRLYNTVIAGNNAVLTNSTGTESFVVTVASEELDTDQAGIQIRYRDIMIVTYLLSGTILRTHLNVVDVVDIGSGQVTFNGTIFPTIPVAKAEQIYEKWLDKKHVRCRWSFTLPYEFEVLGFNDTRKLVAIIHDKIVTYEWQEMSTSDITPSIKEKRLHTITIDETTAYGSWYYQFSFMNETPIAYTQLANVGHYLFTKHQGIRIPATGLCVHNGEKYLIASVASVEDNKVTVEMYKVSDGTYYSISTGVINVTDYVQ